MEFVYKAKTKSDQIVEGTINAPDQNSAVNILHNKGYILLSLEQIEKDLLSIDVNKFLARISNRDVVIFTRQLSSLVDADMPIIESLKTLSKQIQNVKFRMVISSITDLVEGGSSLSMAMANHPTVFSTFYVKLVQSGEKSGKLHDALLYLADYVEKSQAITSKLRGALAYPAFILFSLFIVGAIMAIYVLPQLLSIFEEAGVSDLPITTRVLIWSVNFVNNNLVFLVLTFASLLAVLVYYVSTEDGKIWLDDLKISFPILGPVIRNLYLARISESLSTQLKSGVPILDSLHITGELVGNRTYMSIINEAEQNVRKGGRMSEVFGLYEEIPPMFSSMIAIGEKTGKLDSILLHISKFYKNESENTIQTISTILEPALVLLLGVAVAIMVSSILLPIYNLVGSA